MGAMDSFPSVADLKREAVIVKKEKENEEPVFPVLAYRFCSHDEFQRCMWCSVPQKIQEVDRARHAVEFPLYWERKKAWQAQKKKKEEEVERKKKRRIMTSDEEQKLHEKEDEEKHNEAENKKKLEEARRTEAEWAKLLN